MLFAIHRLLHIQKYKFIFKIRFSFTDQQTNLVLAFSNTKEQKKKLLKKIVKIAIISLFVFFVELIGF